MKDWKPISKISIGDEGFPEELKKIKDPPRALYFLGKLYAKEDSLAIVGSRKATDYGKAVATFFAKELAQAGITIVSGFAPGIDTICHKTCLEVGKRTIAILGTGLERRSIYPQSNLNLVEKILKSGGALISEFEPWQRGTKFTFPRRNRLISGISKGVLVVEAKEKSGALITASFAKEQGKKVFAVPGSIFSKNSKGTHWLIRQGAKLVEDPKEILKELGIEKEKITEKEVGEGRLILKVLEEGPLHIDEIVKRTKLSPQKVISLLTELELEEKVKNLGQKIFFKI